MKKTILSLFLILLSTSAFAECAKQRVINISAKDYPLVGTGQYKSTLPLKEKEIVLTFDDGPSPYTKEILVTLDRYCLKATFFVVGQMIKTYPKILEETYLSGHNIANHSYSHPMPFGKLSYQQQLYQINETTNNIKAIIGDHMVPVFRFPGLGKTMLAEEYLAEKNMSVWSVDIETKDYMFSHTKQTTATESMERVMNKSLQNQNYGMLLMHDIHKTTAAALPYLLQSLIAKGYTFVHVQLKN